MNDPTSADHEWLEARERGESVDHVAPELRAAYRKLEERIGALPPDGWQERVLAQIDAIEAKPPARQPRRRAVWVAGALAAAALVLIVMWSRRPQTMEALALAYEITPPAHTDQTFMGSASGSREAMVGSTLRVPRDPQLTEVRVYQLAPAEGAVLARCPGTRCTPDGVIELVLDKHGSVEIMGFTGCTPPPPRGTRSEDERDAHDQHCEVAIRATVKVI